MTRVKRGVTVGRRHKKVTAQTAGFYGRSKNCFCLALTRLEKSLQYSYRDRRTRKRDFRGLWIQRINAAVREYGVTYSQFMHKLAESGSMLNRKMLSELAILNPSGFDALMKSVYGESIVARPIAGS